MKLRYLAGSNWIFYPEIRDTEEVEISPIPKDEAGRLAALRALLFLDTPPEDRFDRIAAVAAQEFDVPIALVLMFWDASLKLCLENHLVGFSQTAFLNRWA